MSPTSDDPMEDDVTTDWTTEAKGTGAYAELNGLNLYYESHGTGRPLILLHGGLGSGEMFGPILPALSRHHQVIVVDLQGHGRTADIDRPIDTRLMADDIAALIDHLRLEKADLMGYSLGGGVAFFTAVKYPQKVGKLVMASANIRRDAIPPEMLAQQAQVNSAAVEFADEASREAPGRASASRTIHGYAQGSLGHRTSLLWPGCSNGGDRVRAPRGLRR